MRSQRSTKAGAFYVGNFPNWVPRRLPWDPHDALPLVRTSRLRRLLHVVQSGRLRLAILDELQIRAGSDRDPWSPSCPDCHQVVQ